MGSSKGFLYPSLHEKLKPAAKTEWEGLDGTKAKRWFTEYMGVSDYGSLYDMFVPGPHQDLWDSVEWTDTNSFATKSVNARAIAYMDAIHRDLNSLYGENEINSIAIQKQAIGRWLSQSDEINAFLTPNKA